MERPLYWLDGSGSLLVIDERGDLVDTHGRLTAHDVGAAFWTR